MAGYYCPYTSKKLERSSIHCCFNSMKLCTASHSVTLAYLGLACLKDGSLMNQTKSKELLKYSRDAPTGLS